MSYSRSEQIRLELEKYNVQEIIRAIEELGERNTKGLLKPLSYNASKAYNNISVVSLPANPVANEHLAPLGRTAHIGFSAIENAWNEHIDMLAFVAGEMRNSKTNFTLVTNHSNVIDIALVLGAMRLAIDPWICGEDFSVSSGLVISRGIVSTQAVVENLSFSMPTVEVIQMFANVFFSFPTTPTVRNKGFPRELVKLSNELTRIEINNFKKSGGTLLAIAPSASKDQFLRDRIHMQPLKNGTMDLMQGWVIPVAVSVDGPEPPECKILPWRYVDNYDDCHCIMRDIAKECTRQTLVPHVYHEKPSLYEEAKIGISKLMKD